MFFDWLRRLFSYPSEEGLDDLVLRETQPTGEQEEGAIILPETRQKTGLQEPQKEGCVIPDDCWECISNDGCDVCNDFFRRRYA